MMYEALDAGELAVLGVFFDPESTAVPNAEARPVLFFFITRCGL